MKFEIPGPLKAEHEELHAELVKAVGAGGQTGAAAKRVAEVLHAHFVREEEIAMPPLGLLAHLARGGVTADMAEVLPMTESLKAELGRMLGEHEDIVAALGALTAAARREKKPEYVRFAEKLVLHARTEEEVLYPAAILVGEYVKAKLGR